MIERCNGRRAIRPRALAMDLQSYRVSRFEFRRETPEKIERRWSSMKRTITSKWVPGSSRTLTNKRKAHFKAIKFKTTDG
jgi:hypothetical protein